MSKEPPNGGNDGAALAEIMVRVGRLKPNASTKTIHGILVALAGAVASKTLETNEVNPVLRALRENGIEVTAVHNHMLEDEPRLFYMHFWANDDAQKLASGLHAALQKVKVAAG